MNKFLLVLLIPFFSGLYVLGQSNQPLAKEVIQGSVNKYKSYKSSKVDFVYTIESKMTNTKETHTGIIYLKAGNFRLDLGDQIIISDQKKVWTYLKDANEVQINTYNPKDLEINPNEIFIMWEKGFLQGYVGVQTLNQKTVHALELTPMDKTLPYFKVKLYIDKTTKDPVRMQTFYTKGSNILTLDIKSITPNIVINDTYFIFDAGKFPGVEIIDLTQ
jgi:outer membrane lipoprotein-sorting protein